MFKVHSNQTTKSSYLPYYITTQFSLSSIKCNKEQLIHIHHNFQCKIILLQWFL
jgi:hypothetical protein